MEKIIENTIIFIGAIFMAITMAFVGIVVAYITKIDPRIVVPTVFFVLIYTKLDIIELKIKGEK